MPGSGVNLLSPCPFDGLSRLAGLTGKIDSLTGIEMISMFLLAKQFGRLSTYRKLWSRHPVENCKMKVRLLTDIPECCTRPSTKAAAVRVASPDLDQLSPSPSPVAASEKCPKTTTSYSLYRYEFAGLELPILGVGYFMPESSAKKICCYGGADSQGNRCFLSSWE